MSQKNLKWESSQLDLDNNLLTITLEDGTNVDGNILFMFEENGDQFIFYEINDTAFAAKLNPDNSLAEIADDEWELVERIFNEWMEENSDETDGEIID